MEMTPEEIYEAVKAGGDVGWKLVWENVIVPEFSSLRSAELARKYCITDGDLMGMLDEDMSGNRKIDLFRNDGGSLWGWMRRRKMRILRWWIEFTGVLWTSASWWRI